MMNVGFDSITGLERDLLCVLKQNKTQSCAIYLILFYIVVNINLIIFLIYYYNN